MPDINIIHVEFNIAKSLTIYKEILSLGVYSSQINFIKIKFSKSFKYFSDIWLSKMDFKVLPWIQAGFNFIQV